jgi:hypothetical protein
MPSKTKSAKSGNSSRKPGAARRSSQSQSSATANTEPKPPCGAPLKTRKGAFCAKAAVKGGRCRYHIAADITAEPVREALTDELDASLRRLQEVAERHAFFADEAMKDGGNGSKDAAFNRSARTAAALAKTRMELKVRASKIKDGEPGLDPNTNIEITDNHRDPKDKGETPKTADPAPESGASPETTDKTEPDAT